MRCSGLSDKEQRKLIPWGGVATRLHRTAAKITDHTQSRDQLSHVFCSLPVTLSGLPGTCCSVLDDTQCTTMLITITLHSLLQCTTHYTYYYDTITHYTYYYYTITHYTYYYYTITHYTALYLPTDPLPLVQCISTAVLNCPRVARHSPGTNTRAKITGIVTCSLLSCHVPTCTSCTTVGNCS